MTNLTSVLRNKNNLELFTLLTEINRQKDEANWEKEWEILVDWAFLIEEELRARRSYDNPS